MKHAEITGVVATAGDPGETTVTVTLKEDAGNGITRTLDTLHVELPGYLSVEDVAREAVEAKLRVAGILNRDERVMTMTEARARRANNGR